MTTTEPNTLDKRLELIIRGQGTGARPAREVAEEVQAETAAEVAAEIRELADVIEYRNYVLALPLSLPEIVQRINQLAARVEA